MSAFETITVATQGAACVLTLNRPDRLNAWLPKMSDELVHAIEAANDDRAIGAIIVTGAGRGFCAGADIEHTFKSRLSGRDPGADTAGGLGGLSSGTDWIGTVRKAKPLIAAVNGPAVGIGVTMILPFDMIIAAEESKFGFVFVKMGIVPELASSHYLVARCGFGRASELMLSGRLVSGAEAADIRLADRVVPLAQLMPAALAQAEQFAANPTPMLRMTKALLTQNACETDMNLAQQRESGFLRQCWALPEHAEAVNAFLEKRPARFR